jgi:hypothetical protein
MIIHTGGRANGKTVRLIMTAAVTKAPIITTNRSQAKLIEELSIKIGYPVNAYPVKEFGKLQGHNHEHVAIDELDSVLKEIWGVDIVAASVYGITDDMANCIVEEHEE